jgi:hypothetical protein
MTTAQAVERGFAVAIKEMDANNIRFEITPDGLQWLLDCCLEEYAHDYVMDNIEPQRDESRD